ncbi:enoyl-CoA hydratase/isomerase family protein [Oceanibacterium hippocampi]|uniref:Putative enoyl-CoA hydratase n=1 Tax=Oceanibacterium hippocampi TaxID=745714 RepID=A0A1Y5SHD8_9PROT|nr:enoyl-CoA hydratase/isomerase family protein [Oceanibacterium hippocampi]SLN40748.1 putative enoyl-CoA hydratase [Oceanibacterium hippocampi]
MSGEPVILHCTPEGVATVTLNRPEVHNAFNDEVIEKLTEIFEDLANQSGIRVVILASGGKSFSAGADLKWMQRAAEYLDEDNLEDARGLGRLLKSLYTMDKPTIALVQGSAYGGGLGLVAACDIAVAVRSASFALTEVRLGLIPAVISPYVVQAIGARAARRYFLTAEPIAADRAYELGLVSELVDDVHQLAEVRDRLVARIFQASPAAIASSKELIFAVAEKPIDDHVIDDTAHRIAEARSLPDGKEGVSAFLGKRRPNWWVEMES